MIYTLPFISAFIGWFTNLIAIKMLFHPRKPINILGIKIQGIFPKRQAQFAQKLGALVSKELINVDELTAKINNPETTKHAIPLIEEHVNKFIDTKLKEEIPLLSMFISSDTINNIKNSIVTEVELILPMILENITNKLKGSVNIEQMVTEKVSQFSSDKLEDILNQIMKKEFVFIEIIGAILGFIIGVIQIFISRIG